MLLNSIWRSACTTSSCSPHACNEERLDIGRKSPRIRTGRGITRRSTVTRTGKLGKLRTVVGVGKIAISTRDRVIEVELEESTDKILTGERGVWWGCWRVQRAGV